MTTNINEVLQSINKDTWIISDLHLGHKSILDFEPCRTTAMRIDGFENHEEWIIDNWNSVVGKDDTVLCLGDFAFNGVSDYIEKLNGNIIFILGNHDSSPRGDKWINSTVIRGLFINNGKYVSRIQDKRFTDDMLLSGLVQDINHKRYLFCHYDIKSSDEWDMRNKKIGPRIEYLREIFDDFGCDILVHGHVHSLDSKDKETSINVCFEHLDFRPQKLYSLISKTK